MNGPTLPLLSASLAAPATQVVDVLGICTPDDVRALDAPTAEILEVVFDVAKQGIDPVPTTTNAELLRRGLYAGRVGELRKNRLIDATSPAHGAEHLRRYASAVLAEVFRVRLAAAGEGLAAAAVDWAEQDAWQLLIEEGAALRGIWDRLAAARADRGVTEAADVRAIA